MYITQISDVVPVKPSEHQICNCPLIKLSKLQFCNLASVNYNFP